MGLFDFLSDKPKIDLSKIREEFFKGVSSVNAQDPVSSAKHFEKALSLIKDSGIQDLELESSCCFNLAESYKASKRYDDAIIKYKKAIEINRLNEDAYIGLSECYFSFETKDGFRNAIPTLKTCTSIFPNNETAHFNLGVSYFQLDDISNAMLAFKKSGELGNMEAYAYMNHIKKYLK